MSTSRYQKKLESLHAAGLNRKLKERPSAGGYWEETSGQGIINFASNDYLDLSRKPDVLIALGTATSSGACSARLLSGTLEPHTELEKALARSQALPEALVFGAGYLANLGAITVFAGREDTIISDRLIHASLLDGIRLSRARHLRFAHNDMEQLEALLKKENSRRRPGSGILIVTESVFSMDGDFAPLEPLTALAEKYDAELLVDEAHAFGVFGPGGAGRVREAGLSEGVTAITLTLSKSAASYGGAVITNKVLKELLLSSARSFIFNTALPPPNVLTALAAISKFDTDTASGKVLLRRASRFRARLAEAGLNVSGSESQIVPVLIGDNQLALSLSERLASKGIIAPAIRPPTVPPGTERLRFSITLAHTDELLEEAATVIVKEAGELGVV